VRSLPARLLCLAALASAAAACAKMEARMPAPPALAVPIPDRPLMIPVSAEPEPVAEAPPAQSPVADAPAPRPSRPAAARPAEPPAAEPAPATSAPADAPVLLTTQNASELERRAREHLSSAEQSLSRVTYEQLGRDARAQYDEVRKFIRLAEQKLKTRNYVYADELAERAALLASLLVKS
jgi:hypothetical protein